MITPLDIKKQTFERTLRGYNTEEVEDFLSMISVEWELLTTKLRSTEQELKGINEQLDLQAVTQQQLVDQLEQIKHQDKQRSTTLIHDSLAQRDLLIKEINELQRVKTSLVQQIEQLLQSISTILTTFRGDHPSSPDPTPDTHDHKNLAHRSNPTNIDYIIDEID